MSDPTPTPRRDPPKIGLPDWWTDTQAAFGPVLGGTGPTAIGESLDAWAALDDEERSGYLAILAYRQLFALAECTVYLRLLEQRVSRATGTLKQHIDGAASSIVEAIDEAGIGGEPVDDDTGEVEPEEDEPPAPVVVEPERTALADVDEAPAPKPRRKRPMVTGAMVAAGGGS